MAGNKVLVVEDDQTLLEVLKYNLIKEGYAILTANDGVQALDVARVQKPDLVVLDVMLPRLNGFEVCRILRKEMTMPILMLTAKAGETDKVVGLELGADDYMTKPFSMREFLARIKAMLRRSEMLKSEAAAASESAPAIIRAGDLEIDLVKHKISRAGSTIDLSPKEFDLLAFLAKNREQVFSRDQLLEKVWGYEYAGDTRTVDVHIRWLRQKIESDPAYPKYLITVRGVGYKLEG
jgi:DNA-binding response OmpR family regulator